MPAIRMAAKDIKLKKLAKHKIIYCPPYTLLKTFYNKIKNSNISIGAQNCHHSQLPGPFTGSINADLIKSSGAKYVIIGHSENRVTGDTNYDIKFNLADPAVSARTFSLRLFFFIKMDD